MAVFFELMNQGFALTLVSLFDRTLAQIIDDPTFAESLQVVGFGGMQN